MKKSVLLSLLFTCAVFLRGEAHQSQALAGAWHFQQGDVRQTAVFVDGYLSHSVFDVKNKKFISTRGGTYAVENGRLTITWQYDTEKAADEQPNDAWIGTTSTFDISVGNKLTTNLSGSRVSWERSDANEGPMAGVWRITGRKQGEDISQMPLHDRRTLKILSGQRFQWVAINIKTGEFSGTGGGSYTFENGKYTENIEFFSRDNERVGASLTFDGEIRNGAWHHSGLSSTGNPIYEIWNKLEE
ncbi:hypothetical protein [Parapedobacter sp.]